MHKLRNGWHSAPTGARCKSTIPDTASGGLPSSPFRTCLGMTSKQAQHRLAVGEFCDQHSKIAASEVFKVSIRTLYRWCQTLKQHVGSAAALTPESCVPHRRRRPTTPPALNWQIRQLRRQYPNLGKARLHLLLQDWCAQQRLPLPSVSTIGRIIATLSVLNCHGKMQSAMLQSSS